MKTDIKFVKNICDCLLFPSFSVLEIHEGIIENIGFSGLARLFLRLSFHYNS